MTDFLANIARRGAGLPPTVSRPMPARPAEPGQWSGPAYPEADETVERSAEKTLREGPRQQEPAAERPTHSPAVHPAEITAWPPVAPPPEIVVRTTVPDPEERTSPEAPTPRVAPTERTEVVFPPRLQPSPAEGERRAAPPPPPIRTLREHADAPRDAAAPVTPSPHPERPAPAPTASIRPADRGERPSLTETAERPPPSERVVETRIVPRPAPDFPQAPTGESPASAREAGPVRPRVEITIGRIDVEVAKPPPQPAAPAPRERPRGFDDYARLRSYLER